MKLTLTILRYVAFCTLLLAIGQVPVGRSTLGAEYLSLLKRGWDQGTEKVMETKAYATVSEWPFFSLFLKSPNKEVSRSNQASGGEANKRTEPTKVKFPVTSRIAPTEFDTQEEITQSDRESLLRLLK